MKRKLPTILILLVMVLVGAMYWVDLAYYTDPGTGFILRGTVWERYAVALLPLAMCIMGLRTVGPRAISVMRVKSGGLGGVMVAAAVVGFLYGLFQVLTGFNTGSAYGVVLGALSAWYGVWMFLAGMQMFTQTAPSPTKNAIWGVLAGLPFAAITVYRILIRPSSLYRIAPVVRAFSSLFAMLWFGMLLRALYIALPRRRVRWMYLVGVFTFLFSTCLELPLAFNTLAAGHTTGMDLFQSLMMATFGLVAGCVSVAIAGQSGADVGRIRS